MTNDLDKLSLAQDPWPTFLDLLDADSSRAFDEFYRFAHTLLTTRPPSVMRAVRPSDREDLIHDIILHCCNDGFRVLKSYANQGRPFAAWFSFVARNKIINARGPVADHQEVDEALPDQSPDTDDRIADRELVQCVLDALGELTRNCQLLLRGAADGLKPRELTRLMGWQENQNKKASDDLRACRSRLVKVLESRGIASDVLAAVAPASGGAG